MVRVAPIRNPSLLELSKGQAPQRQSTGLATGPRGRMESDEKDPLVQKMKDVEA